MLIHSFLLLPTSLLALVGPGGPNREAVEAVAGTTFVETSPHFFVAVIAGVILAAAFELMLTDLALAAGLNVMGATVGPSDTHSGRGRGHHVEPTTGAKGKGAIARAGEVLDKAHGAVRKLNAAFGLWTLVSVSLSVFFAAWLAVLLSGTFSVLFGALLGLVIWGLFTALMTALEARVITSLLGALVGMARSAFQGATGAASSLFGASPRKQAAETARDVAAAVREEILGGEDVKHQLRDYLRRVEHVYSPKSLRKELEKLLDETEIEFVQREPGPWFDEERVIEKFRVGHGLHAEQAGAAIHGVKEALRVLGEERRQSGNKLDQLTQTALRMTGLSHEEAVRLRERVEGYLRELGMEGLEPETLRRDLEQLLIHPGAGAHALKEHLGHIDREWVTEALIKRTDLTREDVEAMVERFMSVVDSIRGGLEGGVQRIEEDVSTLRQRVTGKIHDYLDSLGRPELSYEGIRHDVEMLLHDPRAGVEALRDRLRSIDRDTIKAMLAHRADLSQADAERIVSRVEEARDAVIQRAEKIRAEVALRVEQAEHEARRQAEETANTASTAAWWAFGTTVASALAAVLGGTMPVR